MQSSIFRAGQMCSECNLIKTWYHDCYSSFCLPLDMMEGVLWFQESAASPFSGGPVSKATLHVSTCQNWQQCLQDAPRCTDRNITDKVNLSQVRSCEKHHASFQNCEKHIHKRESLNANTKRLIRHSRACHGPMNSEWDSRGNVVYNIINDISWGWQVCYNRPILNLHQGWD